jgi:hypothetical protein
MKRVLIILIFFSFIVGFSPYQAQYYDEHYVINPNLLFGNTQVGGKCVAESITMNISILNYKNTGEMISFSENYLYANRLNSDYQGIGMYPKQALESLKRDGVPTLDYFNSTLDYPEILDEFNLVSESAKQNAYLYKSDYQVISNDIDSIINKMVETNAPVLITIPITQNFSKILYGLKGEINSYHAMVAIGYTEIDGKKTIIAKNSWGVKYDTIYITEDYPIIEAFFIERFNKNETIFYLGENYYSSDNEKSLIDVNTKIINGKLYIPIRAFAESNNFEVTWDAVQRKAILVKNSTVIEINPYKNLVTHNGENVEMDYEIVIENNRILIVAREFSELIGLEVTWDNIKKTATIK